MEFDTEDDGGMGTFAGWSHRRLTSPLAAGPLVFIAMVAGFAGLDSLARRPSDPIAIDAGWPLRSIPGFTATGASLRDAVELVLTGTGIGVDWDGLRAAGVDPEQHVTVSMYRRRLDNAVYDLFEAAHCPVPLCIATLSDGRRGFVNARDRRYHVERWYAMDDLLRRFGDDEETRKTQEQVVELVTETIRSDVWCGPYPKDRLIHFEGNALVVRATPDIQAAVKTLLSKVRDGWPLVQFESWLSPALRENPYRRRS